MDQVEVELPNNGSTPSTTQAIMDHGLRARNREPFLRYCGRKLRDLKPNPLYFLMGMLAKLIGDVVTNSSTGPFEDVFRPSDYTSKVSLQFIEGLARSAGDIVQMTMFMTAWAGFLIVTIPWRSNVLPLMLVLPTPFYYFPPLLAKAPNFSVFCGGIEVPIFWYAFLWAFALSLLHGFVIWMGLFIHWKRTDRQLQPSVFGTGPAGPPVRPSAGDEDGLGSHENSSGCIAVLSQCEAAFESET